MAALAMCAGQTAAAQVLRDATEIPVPLVTALLAGNRSAYFETGHFYVKELSPAWPAALTPGGSATVVGGMASGQRVVAVFQDTTSRFLASYLLSLDEKGWRPPPSMTRSEGGFQNQVFESSGPRGYMCKDSASVNATAVPGATHGSFIFVAFQRIDMMCEPRMLGSAAARAKLALPVLTPPSGLRMTNWGGGGGGSSVDSRGVIRDSLSLPIALAEHFGGQLRKAGWTVSAPTANDEASVQSLKATDSEGATWRGSLVISASGNTRELSLKMNRVEGP